MSICPGGAGAKEKVAEKRTRSKSNNINPNNQRDSDAQWINRMEIKYVLWNCCAVEIVQYIFGWITSYFNIFRRTSSGAFKPQKKDASSPHSTFHLLHFKWVVRRLIWGGWPVVTSHISKSSWSTSAGRRLSRTVSTRLATDRQVTNQLVISRIWHLVNHEWCLVLLFDIKTYLGKDILNQNGWFFETFPNIIWLRFRQIMLLIAWMLFFKSQNLHLGLEMQSPLPVLQFVS